MGIPHSIILKPNEQIIRVIRRTILVDTSRYLIGAVFLLLPFFLLYPLLKYRPWGIVVGVTLFCIGLFVCFRTLYLWYHNTFVITSERIIDFDQRGFFEKVASQSSYEKIQDVSFHIHGAWGTMFRYGDVRLKTGWGSVELLVPTVHRPAELQRLILDVQDVFLENVAGKNGATKKQIVPTYDDGEEEI
jgi:hypothetical protein